MRRTALPCAAVLVAVAALFYIFGFGFTLLVGSVLCVAAGICAFLGKRKGFGLRSAVVLLIGAAYCLYVCNVTAVKLFRDEALIGKTHTVTVRVTEEPKKTDSFGEFEVETTGDNGFDQGLSGKVRFYITMFSSDEAFNALEGDILSATVTFGPLEVRQRSFDYPKSIFVSAEATDVKIIGHKESLYTRCIDVRRAVRNRIHSYTDGDNAAILEGLLLGGTRSMSRELDHCFRVTGVKHITAVSGMHIGAFCMMTVTVLSLFMHRRKASLIAIFPMLLAVMLAGLSPSAVRAGIMCSLTLLANCLLKKTDSLNSLGLAVMCMLAVNPFYVCSLSFQLSCSATAGVILVSTFANRLAERIVKIQAPYVTAILHGIVLVFVQSVGAVLCTLPFQIVAFGFVSVIAPLSSVLVCAAAVYAMTVTIIAVSLSFIPLLDQLAVFVFWIPDLLASYIRVTVTALAEIPFAYIPFGSNYAMLWMALSLGFVATWVFLDKVGGKRTVAVAVAALLLVSMWTEVLLSNGKTEVGVVDTGNGLCAVVSFNRKCIIIGCGDDYSDRYAVREYLNSRGITTVEALLIPSDTEVCFEGYKGLKNEIDPKRTVVPKGVFEASEFDCEILEADDGQMLDVGIKNMTARAVKTQYGCVFEITHNGRKAVIGAENYDARALKITDADILVSGRALPQNINAKMILVSSDAEFMASVKDLDMTVTAGRDVWVKFIDGKGMTLYAGQDENRIFE